MAGLYMAYVSLNDWLRGRNWYLVADEPGLFVVRDQSWIRLPTATSTPQPQPTYTPQPPNAALPPRSVSISPTAPLLTGTSTPALPPPTPTPDPSGQPTAVVALPAPVYIRIPAIGVKRSVVELPLTQNSRTGAWTRDTRRLFRGAGKDLVGHWVGSASPGQEGNLILVGHNYGYGYNGVFRRLGMLKAGQQIYVANAAGRTFTYEVTTVKRVNWRRKNADEVAQHLPFLDLGGAERLTLVTCSGANVAPFPARLYVVAKPVP